MARGTTDAIKGNSTGAVLMTRMVLPEPGLSRTQKNGLGGKRKRKRRGSRAALRGPSGRNPALGGQKAISPRRLKPYLASSTAATPLPFDHAARPVESVLSVQLDDLLVVVGALQQLDARVEWPAVGTEADLVKG